jgi:NAD(P)-dependent dehydrogenase (short-subunit alcohol dehydrogenase family)
MGAKRNGTCWPEWAETGPAAFWRKIGTADIHAAAGGGEVKRRCRAARGRRITVRHAFQGSTAHTDNITITQDFLRRLFMGTAFALPLLVDGASGILTGSTASIVSMPAFSVYGASRAAARGFARHWTLDLKERRIRVNVLSPGPTKMPGLRGHASDDRVAQQGLLDQMASEVPLGRVPDPDEIASVALFLASDDSSRSEL